MILLFMMLTEWCYYRLETASQAIKAALQTLMMMRTISIQCAQ